MYIKKTVSIVLSISFILTQATHAEAEYLSTLRPMASSPRTVIKTSSSGTVIDEIRTELSSKGPASTVFLSSALSSLTDMLSQPQQLLSAQVRADTQQLISEIRMLLRASQDGSFVTLGEGETLTGQDENVIGYADRLLLTSEEIEGFNKKGIFVYDIDKTLAKRDMALLEATIDTIEKLMENGHLVVIITGQPIDIQRDRIVTPIAPSLRRSLVVITNEGTVAHHFLPGGREYIVRNDFTEQFTFSEEEGRIMEGIIDRFMDDSGFEYAPGGEFEPREMAQAAFKLEAALETREAYARRLEGELWKEAESLEAAGKTTSLTNFRGWASGSSTISFLHKNANKRDAGLGFLKSQGLDMRRAVYHGDEFFPNGNDAYILGDPDIYIAVVGRYHDETIAGRERVLYISGGPHATTTFANDFMTCEERLSEEGADLDDIVAEVAARSINLEVIFSHSLKEMDPDTALDRLVGNWIPKSRIRDYWRRLLDQQPAAATAGDIERRINLKTLRDLLYVCRECRVGPAIVNALYRRTFGRTVTEDFEDIARFIDLRLFGDRPVDFKDSMKGNQEIRRLIRHFAELLTVILGDEVSGAFQKAVEILPGQDQTFRYSEDKLQTKKDTTLAQIDRVRDALKIFFEHDGVCSWLFAAFGNDLGSFHRFYNIEDLNKPALDVADEIPSEDISELQSGLVAVSGGGGARLLSEIMLKAKLHHLVLPLSATMPFVMVVPAEDDGGSTAVLLYIGKDVYRFELPAMGDSINAVSSLSRGELDEFGEPVSSHFYEAARTRFPLEGTDPLKDEFLQIAFDQIQGLISRNAEPKDWQRTISFLRSIYNILHNFDLINIEGQSFGNIMWLAAADKVAGIKGDGQQGTALRRLDEKQIVAVQRFMSRAFGLDNMIVIPSNLSPGTLYGLLDELVVDSEEGVKGIPNSLLHKPTAIGCGERKFVVREEMRDTVDEDESHTYLDYEIAEGEQLVISHNNKEVPLDNSSVRFNAQVKKERGEIFARFNIGSEQWGEWHKLRETAEVIGLPDEEMKAKAPSQMKWGARVRVVNQGDTNQVLRIYLDRVGAGTSLRFSDKGKITVKGRLVVKQTNITESYHLSKFIRAGFVGREKPRPNQFLLDAITNSKAGCVIGPGSVVTSLLPILLLPEVRSELRAMAERGLPVIFMLNPVKDNETAYFSISSLIEFIEVSCGEPVFGLERGGFITDMFVNDARKMPEHVSKLADLTKSRTTRLRPAERPRGEFWGGEEEIRSLQQQLGSGFAFHLDDLLTIIKKEVRGSAPEDGVGFEPALTGTLLERIILSRMRETAKQTPLYQEMLAVFNGNASSLDKAIEHARRIEGLWSEVEALKRIESLVKILRTRNRLTKEALRNLAPKVIVINFTRTIYEPKEPLSPELMSAIVAYLEAGGRIIITTGQPFEVVNKYLFEGENRIPERYRDSIYISASSGAEIRKGVSDLKHSTETIPQQAKDIIEDILSIYGVPFEGIMRDKIITDRGAFMALHLYDFTEMTDENVDVINAHVVRSKKLKTDDQRATYMIQKQIGGLSGTYDLRDTVIKHLKRRLSEEGIDVSVERVGVGTIDVSVISEVDIIKWLLTESGEFQDIEEEAFLFALTGEGITKISDSLSDALYMAIPERTPRSIFIRNAMIPQLSQSEGTTWNKESSRTLFIEAARGLRGETEAAGLSETENPLERVIARAQEAFDDLDGISAATEGVRRQFAQLMAECRKIIAEGRDSHPTDDGQKGTFQGQAGSTVPQDAKGSGMGAILKGLTLIDSSA